MEIQTCQQRLQLYIYIDLLFKIIFIINNKPEAGEKRILEDGNTIRGQ